MKTLATSEQGLCRLVSRHSACRAPEKRNGIFRNPKTGAAIEVQNAACARFWIEFQFGKWLFPKIGDSLDLLRPSILAVASDIFRTSLAQGCMCA
jgi:hypothetical protein